MERSQGGREVRDYSASKETPRMDRDFGDKLENERRRLLCFLVDWSDSVSKKLGGWHDSKRETPSVG